MDRSGGKEPVRYATGMVSIVMRLHWHKNGALGVLRLTCHM